MSPVDQLTCLSKNCPTPPKQVVCENRGSDGITSNWKCTADLGAGYKFGELNIQCEGYRYSGDEWVLDGSCGLEYEVIGGSSGTKKKASLTTYHWIGIGVILLISFLVGLFGESRSGGKRTSTRSRTSSRSTFRSSSSRSSSGFGRTKSSR